MHDESALAWAGLLALLCACAGGPGSEVEGGRGQPCRADGACDGRLECMSELALCVDRQNTVSHPGPCSARRLDRADRVGAIDSCRWKYDERGRPLLLEAFSSQDRSGVGAPAYAARFDFDDELGSAFLGGLRQLDEEWADGCVAGDGLRSSSWTFEAGGASERVLGEGSCQGQDREYVETVSFSPIPFLSASCPAILGEASMAPGSAAGHMSDAYLGVVERRLAESGQLLERSRYSYQAEGSARLQRFDRGDDGTIEGTRRFYFDRYGKLLDDNLYSYDFDGQDFLVERRPAGAGEGLRYYYDRGGNLLLATSGGEALVYDYSCFSP